MKLIGPLVLAAAMLAGCAGGDDTEAHIAQCKMSPDAKRVGTDVCMSASGYELVSSDWCSKLVWGADVHLPTCYEKRGLWFRLKRFVGKD